MNETLEKLLWAGAIVAGVAAVVGIVMAAVTGLAELIPGA